MAQEEHTSRCSNTNNNKNNNNNNNNNNNSNRSSKKLKNKKVPQRGMGVAQLEKIISEEHQKKDATVSTHNSIVSPSSSCSNLAGMQKVPSFRQGTICSSSIPLPPPLPPNHQPLVSKTDGVKVSSGSKGTSLIGVGGGNWSRLWSEEQSQSYGLDHTRYTAPAPFPGNLGGLPYESSLTIWPPTPNLMLQRSHHLQQPCSSSLVNVSANTSSSSSSSVMNFQIEPPSNQSYCGNNFQPLWPDEEKMVGMKRPYPFSLEDMPIPSFHCKFPSAYVSPVTRSDEYVSCSNGGGTTSIEPAHPTFRENCSSSGIISDAITKKFIDENQILTRDFLKLAPPQISQSRSSSKESFHLSSCTGEQSQFERLPLQKDHSKDPNHLSGRNGSNVQPFLSFFPAAKTPVGQPGNSNGEAGESVDLNLKL